MSENPPLVAQFNGGMVQGHELAQTLREYPSATLQINDGWIDVYSDELPTSHPLNVLSDVVQVAWERGSISDSRFNAAMQALETLRESSR